MNTCIAMKIKEEEPIMLFEFFNGRWSHMSWVGNKDAPKRDIIYYIMSHKDVEGMLNRLAGEAQPKDAHLVMITYDTEIANDDLVCGKVELHKVTSARGMNEIRNELGGMW